MASLNRKRLCAAVWLCAAGCTGGSRDITVEMCGDLAVPRQIDTLRLIARAGTSTPISDGIIELFQCPAEKLMATLPVERTFTYSGDIAGVEVQGIRKGVVVITSSANVDIAESGKAFIGLAQQCLGVTCAEGQTCFKGDCVTVPFVTDKSFCGAAPPDAGAESDAATAVDAGASSDAGDAGFCDNPDTGAW
jgi:hypothetical protein